MKRDTIAISPLSWLPKTGYGGEVFGVWQHLIAKQGMGCAAALSHVGGPLYFGPVGEEYKDRMRKLTLFSTYTSRD